MENDSKKNKGLVPRIILAVLVAVLAMGAIYYIGWFDNKTHVDTPAGDNVEQQYATPDEQTPEEADWQNADGENLREAIVEPEVATQTPPGSETPDNR